MDPNLTDITILIDRSGSMRIIRDPMVRAMNEFLDAQRRIPGRVTVTVAIFDTEYEVVRRGADLAAMAPMTAADLVPRGDTALLDAMVRCIDEEGARLAALPESGRPAKKLFAVVTDGQENRSREHAGPAGRATVRGMVTHQSEVYSWEFVFLGANIDAVAEATSLGIAAGNALNYKATSRGVERTGAILCAATPSYRGESYVRGTFFSGTTPGRDDVDAPAGAAR